MKKSFYKILFTIWCFSIFASIQAATVEFIGIGNSQFIPDPDIPGTFFTPGLLELNIDGNYTLAMCDDIYTDVGAPGNTWEASIFSFADIQAGASVKFSGAEKYSQAGYLFSLLNGASFTEQSDINLAIWNIMDPASVALSIVATDYYNTATSGLYNTFDYTGIMNVLTPNSINANQEFLIPSTVPIPASLWLFGSGLIGLVGFARRKKI